MLLKTCTVSFEAKKCDFCKFRDKGRYSSRTIKTISLMFKVVYRKTTLLKIIFKMVQMKKIFRLQIFLTLVGGVINMRIIKNCTTFGFGIPPKFTCKYVYKTMVVTEIFYLSG